MAYKLIGFNPGGFAINAGPTADRPAAGSQDGAAGMEYWHTDSTYGKRERSDGAKWIDITSGSDAMDGVQFASGTLLDGNPVIVPMAGARMGCTVWVEPVAGDTVTVKYSRDDEVTYYDWPRGPVTTGDADVLVGAITHLSFQRTAGAGTTSKYGVTR